MEDTSYVIYEDPIPVSSNDYMKSTTSNSLQIPSSLVMSSICLSGNQNLMRHSVPLSHLIKENIATLSESELIEAKPSNLSHYNLFPSSILPNSVISFQDDSSLLHEDTPCKMEESNDAIIDNSCFGAGEAGSTYKVLLAPLQYSTLIKNNTSDKIFGDALHSESLNVPITGESCSENLVDVCNKAFVDSNSSLVSASFDSSKSKKNSNKPQLVVKLLQDDLNFDMVEIISPNADNSHIFEIIEKESDTNKLNACKDDSVSSTLKLVANNEIKVVQQNNDFGENVSSACVFYNCSQCNKFLPVESFLSHKKECIAPNKAIKFSNTGISKDSAKYNSVSKPNVYWLCLICNQECSSIVNLKYHYSSHSVEELSLALLRCTFPVNNRIEKSTNTDESTMTESLNSLRNEKTEQVPISDETAFRKSTDYNKENTLNAPITACDSSTDNGNPLSPSNNDFISDNADELKNSEFKSLINRSKKRSIKTGLKSRDPHSCHVCQKILSSRGNLVKHLVQHQEVKPWVCKECGIGFNSKRDHDHHYLQRHTTLRPNICSICGKGFTNKRTLIEHMVFHKKEREFKCELCSKHFRTKKCVNRHMQRHETSRNFVCNICCKAFRVNIDLVAHVKLVHNAERKKKFKATSNKSQPVTQDSITLDPSNNYSSETSLVKKASNNKIDKSLGSFSQIIHDQLPIQIVSNSEQIPSNKIKEFSNLLHANSSTLMSDGNCTYQPINLTEAREAIIINGDIEGQSLIPVTSSTEEQEFNTSYSLTLHNNKTAILNEDSSGGTFVMIGLTGCQNTNKANWNVSQQYKIYEDANPKEQTISPQEIELLPGIVENMSRSYMDEFQQVAPKCGSKLLINTPENMRILRRINNNNNDKGLQSDDLHYKGAEKSVPMIQSESLCEVQSENISDPQSQSLCDTQTQTVSEAPQPSTPAPMRLTQTLGDSQHVLSDSQTQALSLDIFSQTLHLDFQGSQVTESNTFS